jgi:hypothetical protein
MGETRFRYLDDQAAEPPYTSHITYRPKDQGRILGSYGSTSTESLQD